MKTSAVVSLQYSPQYWLRPGFENNPGENAADRPRSMVVAICESCTYGGGGAHLGVRRGGQAAGRTDPRLV
jgi:hypothetical protein